jgi:hypothetical protein
VGESDNALNALGASHLNLNYGTRNMLTQGSSLDIRRDNAFRSITGMIFVLETKSASRISSKPPFRFCNNTDDLTESRRQQFRINTALSVIAIRAEEVVTVLSSIEKTADTSSSYVVVVNPRLPKDPKNKHTQPHDILFYQSDDDKTPCLVSGKAADEVTSGNPYGSNFLGACLWVYLNEH